MKFISIAHVICQIHTKDLRKGKIQYEENISPSVSQNLNFNN